MYPAPKDHELTAEEKKKIRKELPWANSYELAKKFKCTVSQIAGIKAALTRAKKISSAVMGNLDGHLKPELPDIDLLLSVSEGKRRLVLHLMRERDRRLVNKKKDATLRSCGNLSCEACGFDFSAIYGHRLGEGFCEVHHLIPLARSNKPTKTTIDDLAVLCSNCHRIIHRSNPMLSVAELSKRILESVKQNFRQVLCHSEAIPRV